MRELCIVETVRTRPLHREVILIGSSYVLSLVVKLS